MSTNNTVLRIQNLSFQFADASTPLFEINALNVTQGNHVFIQGDSGAGKTTFLNILAGIQPYSHGSIKILDQEIKELTATKMNQFRANHMGIIFQLFNLIPYLNITENTVLPTAFSATRKKKALANSNSLNQEAQRLLAALGLHNNDLQKLQTTQLSVGQQQRVSAARALLGQPEIIIADEPTSALDQKNTQRFMELLMKECDQNNSTLLFVSHNTALKSYFNHAITIQ